MHTLLFVAGCGGEAGQPDSGPADPPVDSAPADTAPDDSPPVDTGEDSSPGATLSLTVPEAPRRQVDPLVCAAPDASGELAFRWTVDGAPFTGVTLTTSHPGDTVFPGYTRAGQTWTCTVTDEAGLAGSATTTIADVDLADLDPVLTPMVSAIDGVVRYAGRLAHHDAVRVRYGFDGWSERSAPASARLTTYDEGDALYHQELALTYDGAAWVGRIDVPARARAVQLVFTAGAEVDDADGLEYTWDFVFPSVGPFLTFNDAARPEEGVVVNWATGQPGLGIVEYGPDEANVAFLVGAETGTLHHVPITGLPPDTTWVYRARDATGRVSPWGHFTTAGPDLDTFTFLVMSDMQDGGGIDERWAEIAAQMAAGSPDARFVVAPGDLAANDHPGLWWLFFDSGRGLFDHVPILPATGNHDSPGKESNPDTSSFQRWFDLSTATGDEDWRRDDYGRVRIFSLDSETVGELVPGGAQYEWLAAEMDTIQAGDAPDWALVQIHHPPYDAGGRFADESADFRPFTALLDGSVNLVVGAHEHIYQRFLPLRYDGTPAPSGRYGTGPDDGVCYLVTASAANLTTTAMVHPSEPGGEQRGHLAWPEIDDGVDSVPMDHGYLVVDVTPAAMEVRAVGLGTRLAPVRPTVRDTVTLER